MPDISLLQPQVLRGVVEKLTAPESMILLNRVPKQPWPFPAVTWDVVSGSRTIASPNVPNSEAQIVSRLTRSQKSASFVYTREKKVFEPTTLHWLREPGQLAKVNAEAAVLREVQDLDNRAQRQVSGIRRSSATKTQRTRVSTFRSATGLDQRDQRPPRPADGRGIRAQAKM